LRGVERGSYTLGMGDRTFINRAMLFAPSIQLFDAGAPPKTVAEFKWIHCANEGLYKGHHQGEFNLTRATFEAFVRNFRDDPQYLAGALDVVVASDAADATSKTYTGGVRPVIQFDYEHASEMPSWEGTIPTSGAPAAGWVLDVCVRSAPDGKAQLWAFGKLGEQIRGQIGRDEYRSVSIAFTLEGVHWVTAAPIGPVLTSIAFTNHPFMRDLEPLAAANRGTSAPARGSVKRTADPQRDPSEAPDSGRTTQPTGGTMAEELRERLCKTLGIRTAVDDNAVAAAVDEVAGSAGDLKGLLEALGVAKPEDAMKVIPELRSAREKIASLLSELDALLQQDVAADAAVAQTDVGAAMKAAGFQGEGAKKALGAYREKCMSEELKKATTKLAAGEVPTLSVIRAARSAGRAHFLKEYGIKDGAADEKLSLTRPLVAGKGGAQFEPPPLAADDRGDGSTIDLRGLSGANITEKLITYLTKAEPGFEKLPYERKIKRASELKRTAQLTQ
jgi:hypothetical protein